MQITPKNTEDESNHTIAAACTPFPKPTKTMSISCGFENMNEKVLEVQDHSYVQRCKFKWQMNIASWKILLNTFSENCDW